ncbi:MAG: hypothetical protein CW346_03905 [Bacillaceae bacterium]|nr:hypothetical protein [Bacillaceae bacterium]
MVNAVALFLKIRQAYLPHPPASEKHREKKPFFRPPRCRLAPPISRFVPIFSLFSRFFRKRGGSGRIWEGLVKTVYGFYGKE